MLLRNAHFKRTVLLAGTSVGLLGYVYKQQQQRRLEEAVPRRTDAELRSLMCSAVNGMCDVPGSEAGVLYLAPVPRGAPAAPSAALPKLLSKSVVFTLSASDMMGIERSPEENHAANLALEDEIDKLRRPCTPRAWWRSFAFDAEKGWREDGFCVAFGTEEKGYARVTMARLAQQFK